MLNVIFVSADPPVGTGGTTSRSFLSSRRSVDNEGSFQTKSIMGLHCQCDRPLYISRSASLLSKNVGTTPSPLSVLLIRVSNNGANLFASCRAGDEREDTCNDVRYSFTLHNVSSNCSVSSSFPASVLFLPFIVTVRCQELLYIRYFWVIIRSAR